MAPLNNQPPGGPNREQPPPLPPSRLNRGLMGWVVFIGLGLLVMTLVSKGYDNRREISIVEFWRLVNNGQLVNRLDVLENRIEGQCKGDTPVKKGEGQKFFVNYNYALEKDFQTNLRTALAAHKNEAEVYDDVNHWWTNLLPQVLLMALIFGGIWFFVFRRLGAATGGGGFLGSFGRSRHRVLTKEHVKVTFDDVAGIDEAKDEVAEIIEFLRNPRKFQRLGGRVPRGVLLVGEPGCGKTLLAKAIAGEAEVPFFSISGSDFVEMFVGVGASRVRDLFKQAKESAPCIIFLDEIDAVGRRRGVGFNGGGHDEREQTLNAILVEIDGFDSSDQVIVIAATNRADVLDPALTRPGRFDRQIFVPLPDLAGRLEILRIYAAKVKCGPNVDLQRMARGTPMFSGADLEAMVNEAAIAATMANKETIEHADMEEARDKVRWGRARKSRVIDEKEKEMTAYHEAGHALVQLLTPDADPLHKVSIIPRGHMGGATFSLPEKDRYMYTRRWCEAFIRVAIAGRLAEEMFCGDVDSGAASDITNATDCARKMVLDWGMSDKLGFVRYAPDPQHAGMLDMGGKDYSEKTAEIIDSEIKRIMDAAAAATTQILQANRDKLQGIAQALLKYETLSAEDVRMIMDGKTLDKPTVDELLRKEGSKTPPSSSSKGAVAPPPVPGTPPLPQPGY